MEQADALIQRSTRLLDQTHKLVERTQVMLAQLQSFQAALEQLRDELTTHDDQLQTALNQLKQLGVRPEPKPPSAFMEPAAAAFPWEVPNGPEAGPPPSVPPPTAATFAPGRPERRAALRRGGNLVAIELRREPDGSPVSSGWVLDRSIGGLGLLAEAAAQPQEALLVRPAGGGEGIDWIRVEVRYCQPLGSSWRIGCRFMSQLTWEQVRLFG